MICFEVDGQWGNWMAWSAMCFCNGTQPRKRLCNNPSPQFSGRSCKGPDTMYRNCDPLENCISKFTFDRFQRVFLLFFSFVCMCGGVANLTPNLSKVFNSSKNDKEYIKLSKTNLKSTNIFYERRLE
jgi:hypothetical protein